MEIRDGKTYCEKCSKEVVVREKPGDVNKAELSHVLVDGHGHVVAERETTEGPWRKPE